MIDLHCHSTCSDGTFTPEELAEKGRGFTVFALTDHDNCDGCARFLAAGRGHAGLRLTGVELSIEPGEGYEKFHLLGLGVDPESPRLNAFLDQIRAFRNERNRRIVRRLAELGMPIRAEELLKYANGKIVARPHIARVLMDHGWATSVKDAFARLLGDGRPAFVPRIHPPQAEAIDVVHAAGGVAVMAHPRYWTQDLAKLRAGLLRLMDLGLDGVEAVYRANLPGETVEHLRIARELGLAVTAGSDFHGANKPDIPLGMRTEDDAAFLAPILARLEETRKRWMRA
ncbi:MAG: PHP domain-containing protein [Kiritimatiellia bacterium]